MSMIKVKNLQKRYGTLAILSDISFSIGRGEKVALVGHNGTGKTTLLKIVAGIEVSDAGVIEIFRNACVGYLPQDTSLSRNETISGYLRMISGVDVIEEELKRLSMNLSNPVVAERYGELNEVYERMEGYAFDRRMEIILSGFGLNNVGLNRRIPDLSSGQKSKVALTGILLKGVDILLLDEPTNNLDLPALIWLENFLQETKAACIIISHDRRFLDRVAKKVLELDWCTHTLTATKGTYSDYLKMTRKRIMRQKEEYRLQQEEISRLHEKAREKRVESSKGSRWIGSDNDKFLRGFKRDRAGKSAKTAKVIEKRIERIDKIERPIERDVFKISLEAERGHGALDIRLLDVVAGYLNGFKIGPISLDIRYGERIGIMGLNGSGKSTLLKAITGQLSVLEGKIEIGSGVRIGNMMQEHETLPRNSTLLSFIMERTHISLQDSYAKLAKFGFNESQVSLSINTLSPGGRARLLLALFSAQSVNTLVLDEPTNHLDIEASEALEETIETYQGTILIVSHDRFFLEKASLDETYILSAGTLTKIPDYREYVKVAEERAQKLLKLL